MLCDPSRAVVHRLDGDAAALVLRARDGQIECLGEGQRALIDTLVELDILVECSAGSSGDGSIRQYSRRKVMGFGAAATAAGIVTLALPEAAAAASVSGGSGTTTPATTSPPLPAQPSEGPSYQRLVGVGSVLWAPDPEAFTYTFSIVQNSGANTATYPLGTGGTLSAGLTFIAIIENIPNPSSFTVTLISNTSPSTTATVPFQRP